MKVVLVVIVTMLVLFGIFFFLFKDEYGKQCGGFAGETGDFKCSEYMKCVYRDDGMADHNGVCKFTNLF